MSNFIIPLEAQAPEGAEKNAKARVPTYVLGAVVGVGLLLLLPGQAKADGYGHAEITLGFPNGQVTVGKTWDDHPREVVVEQVTHKYPDPDFDEDEDDVRYDGDADESDEVIIEKRVVRPRVKKVTIIERYVEAPVRCDREEVNVVRRVYVEPRHSHRSNVVVYRAPQRVIYAPSRTVIVAPGNHGHHSRGSDGPSYNRGGGGPRNLFPEDSGRPVRTRGVQQRMVQVGGHSH
jgi:hypothetical protein